MKNKPPKYVHFHNTAMHLCQKDEYFGGPEPILHYWRDAGQWGIDFRFDEVEQKWFSVCSDLDTHWLDNVELVPITKTEWKEDNEGYI